MPVAAASWTAPAVFDGAAPGPESVCEALKICGTGGARGATFKRHFSESDAWSMVTPGPIVELTEIFCR